MQKQAFNHFQVSSLTLHTPIYHDKLLNLEGYSIMVQSMKLLFAVKLITSCVYIHLTDKCRPYLGYSNLSGQTDFKSCYIQYCLLFNFSNFDQTQYAWSLGQGLSYLYHVNVRVLGKLGFPQGAKRIFVKLIRISVTTKLLGQELHKFIVVKFQGHRPKISK